MTADVRVTLILPAALLLRIKSVLRAEEGEKFQQFMRTIALEEVRSREDAPTYSQKIAEIDPTMSDTGARQSPALPHRRELTPEERAQIPKFLLNK